MDRGFQSLLLTGKYGVDDGTFPPVSNSDDAYLTSQMSSHTQSYDKSLQLSLLNYPYSSISSYDILNGGIQIAHTCENSNEYNRWRCVETEQKHKRPKTEPSSELFSFFPTNVFSQLPELRSMEQVNQQNLSLAAATAYQNTLESTIKNFQLTPNSFTPAPPPLQEPPAPPPLQEPPAKLSGREMAYKRRQTLSDKTRSLQKLLPVDKKMVAGGSWWWCGGGDGG